MVREFADTVVAPRSYEADRTETLPMDVVAQMGEMGLFGLPFPEEYGGQGGDYIDAVPRDRGSSAASTSPSRSPSRPASASARCRSSASAPTRRSRSGCPMLVAGHARSPASG